MVKKYYGPIVNLSKMSHKERNAYVQDMMARTLDADAVGTVVNVTVHCRSNEIHVQQDHPEPDLRFMHAERIVHDVESDFDFEPIMDCTSFTELLNLYGY